MGCICDPHRPPHDFLSRVASWAAMYLCSFQPCLMECRDLREYLEAHGGKYSWVDTVDIDIGDVAVADARLAFQRRFDCVEQEYDDDDDDDDDVVDGRRRRIRLDFKAQIRDWVAFTLDACDVDPELFEWKPLILRIDVENEEAYFEDPSDGRRSRVWFNRPAVCCDDPIPWFVFVPFF